MSSGGVSASSGGFGTRARLQLAASIGLALLAILFAAHEPRSIFEVEPWLSILPPPSRWMVSLLLGVAIGAAVVAFARRWILWTKAGERWLRTMGPSLVESPAARTAVLTVAAAVAEELAFRGLLVPTFGVLLPALAFAALHAFAPRDARAAWTLAAFLFGSAMGALFLATGDLSGPIAAHVLVNAANSRWIRRRYERLYGRDRSGEAARRSGARPLGGLLGPRV